MDDSLCATLILCTHTIHSFMWNFSYKYIFYPKDIRYRRQRNGRREEPEEKERRWRRQESLVTGGNGFIGTWLVKLLLSNHYTVSATYQPGITTAHLLSLPSAVADANLTLFPADLLNPDAILAAADGCVDGVFHVASPCTLEDPEDPELELILPAVQGTVNVLDAARKVGARRVVATSSISAMVPNPTWMEMEKVVDEDCWTDVEYCRDMKTLYPMSKTTAERTAWEYSAKRGIDIVTIHPSTSTSF